jgi:hypothetical protein
MIQRMNKHTCATVIRPQHPHGQFIALAGKLCCQRTVEWMPREDSNLDKRSQSPVSYR